MKKENIFIIGARRGLGREILNQWREAFPQDTLAGSSRREMRREMGQEMRREMGQEMRREMGQEMNQDMGFEGVQCFVFDMSLPQQVESLLQTLRVFSPTRVFYVAGGGPHGDFAQKEWKDHEWALAVSLLSPLRVVHFCLNLPTVKQIVVVGSAIAESQPDPGAASYAAAKHGLKGCISSLQSETAKDVRLFSPGYMSTDMLPPQAQARVGQKAAIDSPGLVAKLFIDWVQNPQASWHWEGRPRT
jgi:short-subunit dehydrogenase